MDALLRREDLLRRAWTQPGPYQDRWRFDHELVFKVFRCTCCPDGHGKHSCTGSDTYVNIMKGRPRFTYRHGLNTLEVPAAARARKMSSDGASGLYVFTNPEAAHAELEEWLVVGIFVIPPDATFIEWNWNRDYIRTDKLVLLDVVNYYEFLDRGLFRYDNLRKRVHFFGTDPIP